LDSVASPGSVTVPVTITMSNQPRTGMDRRHFIMSAAKAGAVASCHAACAVIRSSSQGPSQAKLMVNPAPVI
jgi:hypothetical protein